MPLTCSLRCVQFERTLIVADEGSKVSYLEGCTAPSYDKNQVRVSLEVVVLRCTHPAVSCSKVGMVVLRQDNVHTHLCISAKLRMAAGR